MGNLTEMKEWQRRKKRQQQINMTELTSVNMHTHEFFYMWTKGKTAPFGGFWGVRVHRDWFWWTRGREKGCRKEHHRPEVPEVSVICLEKWNSWRKNGRLKKCMWRK